MIGAGLFRATLAAAKEVGRLDAPADQKSREFFKQNPQLGRRDRNFISETIFDILRHRRRYSHWCSSLGGNAERGLVLASMVRRQQFFAHEGSVDAVAPYVKPLELTTRDQEWLRNLLAQPASLEAQIRPQVVLSLPDWAFDLLTKEYGAQATEKIGAAALIAAPLDLRVNTLKTTTEKVQANLKQFGIDALPIPWLTDSLRVHGKPALDKTDSFLQGEFEVQDAGSQWLAHAVDAKRGQTVVDFCAGAGGKTLALAASMRNTGQIYAVDISAIRLNRLRPRLARSGVTNVQPLLIDTEHDAKLKRLKQRADRVLVDAPCSGSGTWRRNPDLKWRQQAAGLANLQDQQVSILSAAAQLVRPNGHLIYSTCSLFPTENKRVIERFFEDPVHAAQFELHSEALKHPVTQQIGASAQLLPSELDADGFFVCVLRRKVAPKAMVAGTLEKE